MSCIFTLCVRSCKAAFCVKSSTCKLFCFMGICQLQSNLIMPSSKNQRFGFFWKTFCPIPGPLIGLFAWLVLHLLLVYWFHHLHVFDKPINVFKPFSDVSMKIVLVSTYLLLFPKSNQNIKVRKNGQQETCNLFCNIAANQGEKRCCALYQPH